jgi:hypothetical protein
MLHHSWSYVSLVHDIFNMSSNKIQQNSKKMSFTIQDKEYDFDFNNDQFLKDFGTKEIHVVGDNVDQKLTAWKKDYDDLNNSTRNAEVSDISNNLTSALDKLPQMRE